MRKKQNMEQFETIDIDSNTRQFQYIIEYGDELSPNKVYFKVFSIPKNPLRWFSYNFQIIDNNIAKGEMMTNNGNNEFSQKGIPEKIIEIASIILKRKIISSPTIYQAGNYLIGSSYKAWERLVSRNKNANLDKKNNCFFLNYIK